MSRRWPQVRLRDVLESVHRPEVPVPGESYRQLGVRLWGAGAYEREPMDGSATKYSTLFRVCTDDIVVNKIWARNGSVAVVQHDLDGCFVSSEFPTFRARADLLLAGWMHWQTKTRRFWGQCAEKSRGTSGKNRIKPDEFLRVEIPLPPLDVQRRIVAHIDELSAKVAEARRLEREATQQRHSLLLSSFRDEIKGARRIRMNDVAPLVRRPMAISVDEEYPELGIRSFGRGTFKKPALSGIEVGSKKLYEIHPGDLVFSNVFAWEGAVAVVEDGDQVRYGSHRFITCVPKVGICTPRFLCFYFLTAEGLKQLGEASPGGAGRNRTLGLKALGEIEVPIVDYDRQLWFDGLQEKMAMAEREQTAIAAELDALLPSILHRALNGEL